MVDTDIGLRNLDVVLGLENRIVYDLVDAVRGNCLPETGVDQGQAPGKPVLAACGCRQRIRQRFLPTR